MSSKKESELNDLENSQSVHTAKTKQNKTKTVRKLLGRKRISKVWLDYHLIKRLHTRFYEYRHFQFELKRMEDSS